MTVCVPSSKDLVTANLSCINCLKKNLSLFKDLTERELEILERHRSLVHYEAGEFIYKENERISGLLCLSAGKCKIINKGNNGNEHIIALKKPVEFLGLSDLVQGDHYLSSAVALEDSSVCIIEKNDFVKVISNNMDLALKMIQYQASELTESNKRATSLCQKHMRARLADALLFIHNIYGVCTEDGSLSLDLKRSDIASLSNMTTANAIKILSDLTKENIVSVDKRKIRIIRFNKLENISLMG
jgi:CRP/FNR family transcriptional regulator, polysaccharide utilization system transcription regulator